MAEVLASKGIAGARPERVVMLPALLAMREVGEVLGLADGGEGLGHLAKHRFVRRAAGPRRGAGVEVRNPCTGFLRGARHGMRKFMGREGGRAAGQGLDDPFEKHRADRQLRHEDPACAAGTDCRRHGSEAAFDRAQR